MVHLCEKDGKIPFSSSSMVLITEIMKVGRVLLSCNSNTDALLGVRVGVRLFLFYLLDLIGIVVDVDNVLHLVVTERRRD